MHPIFGHLSDTFHGHGSQTTPPQHDYAIVADFCAVTGQITDSAAGPQSCNAGIALAWCVFAAGAPASTWHSHTVMWLLWSLALKGVKGLPEDMVH